MNKPLLAPESIDLSTFPSLPLANRKQLPQTAGIYFAIDAAGMVQYIGQSINLRQRWKSHHCQGYVAGGGKIAYVKVGDTSLLKKVEQALIQYFDPPLNIKGRFTKDKVAPKELVKNTVAICKLRQLMTDKGLTQLEVSKATGLNPGTVGKLYRNQFERIDVVTATALCKYFKVGIKQLFEVIFEEEDRV